MFALRGGELAHYHGAEHIAIGRYEHGDGATKEHERCGGHLIGPLLATTAVGNVLAGLAPERMQKPARAAAQLGALAATTELFGWMTRHPDNLLAQGLSKPGHELQHRLSTAEPTPEQLEVAEAALAACLALEHGDELSQNAARSRALRPAGREDARRLVQRRVLQPRARHAAAGRTPSARRHAGLPEEAGWLGGMDEAIAILKLCSHDYDGLEIRALYDGDEIEPYEPVMHIEGDYTAFAHLETPFSARSRGAR